MLINYIRIYQQAQTPITTSQVTSVNEQTGAGGLVSPTNAASAHKIGWSREGAIVVLGLWGSWLLW